MRDLLTSAELYERYSRGEGPILVDADEMVLLARSLHAITEPFNQREGEPFLLFGRPVELVGERS
jgi:hypothetical protein